MPSFRPQLRLIAYPALFVAGAVVGTFWDQFHVQSHTLVYASPTVASQAWWVPLEFGAVFAAGTALFVFLGDLAPRRGSPRVAGIELVWLTGLYALTAFASSRPWIVTGLLGVALLVRIGPVAAVVRSSPVPAITLIVLGPTIEAMLITAGVFHYRTSQIGPIPAWLPLLYANAIVFAARAAEAALQLFGRRRVAEPATAVLAPPQRIEAPKQNFTIDIDEIDR